MLTPIFLLLAAPVFCCLFLLYFLCLALARSRESTPLSKSSACPGIGLRIGIYGECQANARAQLLPANYVLYVALIFCQSFVVFQFRNVTELTIYFVFLGRRPLRVLFAFVLVLDVGVWCFCYLFGFVVE